jgi:hypothetical protein
VPSSLATSRAVAHTMAVDRKSSAASTKLARMESELDMAVTTIFAASNAAFAAAFTPIATLTIRVELDTTSFPSRYASRSRALRARASASSEEEVGSSGVPSSGSR